MFQDEAAEYRLLACVVDDPALVLKLTEGLFTGARIAIFQAMRAAYLQYGELTSEGVERHLGMPIPNEIEAARGVKPGAIVDRLADLATRRQLVTVSEKLVVAATSGNTDRAYIGKTMRLDPVLTNEDSSLAPGVTQFISDLQRKMSGQYKFVDTGLVFLNHMLGGEWPRQALTVIIGQAGGGKTALVCQSIIGMAQLGIPSLFVSLEMPKYRIISRFAANLAGVDGMKLRAGKLNNEEVARVDEALQFVQTLPIYIVDNPSMTVESIAYQVKTHKELYGIEAFFVDYLQIVSRPVSENDSESLGYIAQSLRNVAVQEDLSAIALSQQNRQYKGLQSILGSGRISHIADSVFEIELEETASDEQRICTLDFHKNRDGAVGACTSIYRPRYLRFE